MTHRMILNQTGYFGRGSIGSTAPEIARRNLTRAVIVTDPPAARAFSRPVHLAAVRTGGTPRTSLGLVCPTYRRIPRRATRERYRSMSSFMR